MSPPTREQALRKLAEEKGISGGKIFQPLRVALTGKTVSPGIFDVLLYGGRAHALARIADGTYGRCEVTGEPIAPERLQALPWTRWSVAAAAQREKSR